MIRHALWIAAIGISASAQQPVFVQIPAGSFIMGCDAALPCAESLPRKRVEFDRPFQMAVTEVTVSQFRKFVKATGYRTDAEKAGETRNWQSPGFPLRGSQPVVFMSLNDAKAYCESIGARVPQEAEWEYAARAGSTTYHYWGEEIDDRYLWYFNNTDRAPGIRGPQAPERVGTLRYGRQRDGMGAARTALEHHARQCGLGPRRIVCDVPRTVSARQRTAAALPRSRGPRFRDSRTVPSARRNGASTIGIRCAK